MMQAIGKELEDAIGAFSFDRKLIQVLDLYIALGGFIVYSIQKNLIGVVDAFSLLEVEGGAPSLGTIWETRHTSSSAFH